jgi:beta-glucosidase
VASKTAAKTDHFEWGFDPNFTGRMEENFGEDPFHVGAFGVAAVHGLQGRDGCGGANTTLPPNKISSQAKHFAVYGAGSRDAYTPMGGGPSERTVFEVYLRSVQSMAMF